MATKLVYILPHKIQKRRFELLQKNARAKGLHITDQFTDQVNYVVSEYSTVEQTAKALYTSSSCFLAGIEIPDGIEVVNSAWLSLCIRNNGLVPVLDEHRLPRERSSETAMKRDMEIDVAMPEYACQRVALLDHHNKKLTDALFVLESHAEMKDDDINGCRALAFRRAAAALMSFPRRVIKPSEIASLPDIGGHCLKVIEELLENGFSSEVEAIENDRWYQNMKLFTCVFGVGPATAKKWTAMGLSTIRQVMNCEELKRSLDDPRISVGLEYFDDLQLPVYRTTAEAVKHMILNELNKIKSGITVELAGGFRRGKISGHDIDLLISHPVDGEEKGILPTLLRQLQEAGHIIYGRLERATYAEWDSEEMSSRGARLKSSMDGFEKWFGILKVDDNMWNNCSKLSEENSQQGDKLSKDLLFEIGQMECRDSCRQNVTNRDKEDLKTFSKSCDERTAVRNLCGSEGATIKIKDVECNSEQFEKFTDFEIIDTRKVPKTCSAQASGCAGEPQDYLTAPSGKTHLSSSTRDLYAVCANEGLHKDCVNEDSHNVSAINNLHTVYANEDSHGVSANKKLHNVYANQNSHPVCASESASQWTARRVDLIVIPASQYYYGLVGWTGGRHFNRSLRLYSQREFNMRLSSHGLYDLTKKCSIPANSEQEVFTNLKLSYREPHERNC